jgi:tektin-2
LIKDARNLLEKKGQEAWHQIARLQEVRQHILRDLGEKIIALDIDRYLLNLNESSTEISFRPDPLRIPKGMMTPQAWEEQSRYNKLRADNELATSVKLREAMLLTIDQTYNDIRSQREVTDFALRKRLHEMMKTGDDLQHQRQKVLCDPNQRMTSLVTGACVYFFYRFYKKCAKLKWKFETWKMHFWIKPTK